MSIPVGAFVLIWVLVRLVGSGVLSSTFSGSDNETTPPRPTFGNSPATLPQSAEGYSQISSGKYAKAADTYSSRTDPAGKGAAYGKQGNPAFLVALLPSLNGYPPNDLLEVLGSGFDAPADAGSPLGSKTTQTRGKATVVCAPLLDASTSYRTICTAGGAVPSVVVFGLSSDSAQTLDFTAALANSL